MLRLTYQDIVNLNPCGSHHPSKYIPTDWEGTICQLLELPNVAPAEKLWVARRVLDAKILRLFAVDCARRALSRTANPAPASVAACDVAERYARGLATTDALRSAYADADAAYTAAATAADAYAAAYDAANAARSAATAAMFAADVAATTAAMFAAYTAADAAYAAGSAARTAAAESAERKLQITRLICIIEEQETSK